jgi:hypothetical protein
MTTTATATPATNPVAQAAESVVAAPQANDDYSSLLLADETPKTPEPEATPEVATPEPEADAAATPEQQVTQQPGTPDKAMQKLQQDLAATQRLLIELAGKQAAGDPLTQREQQRVEQATRKVDAVKKAIADKSFDLFEHGGDIAEALLEVVEENGSLRQQVESQGKTLAQMQEQVVWDKLAATYQGVDVRKVWDQAAKEAEPYADYGQAAYQRRADELFHQRCDAASKSVKAKVANTTKPTLPSVPAKTPVTPGGARVTQQVSQPAITTPASQEDAAMADYMKLVVPEGA